jgi:drug/metabolite transporter (DMT)-like permease
MTLEQRGALMVAVGAVTMSFAPVIVKLVGVSPTSAAFYRMGVGGLVLAAVAFRRMRIDLGGRLWTLIVSAGIIFALDLAFWHRSIQYVGPGLATILGNCQIFFMAWFGWIILGERIGPRYLLGAAMAMIGLFLLVGDGWAQARPGGDFRLGVTFGVLTALMYAAYLITLRYTQLIPGKLGPLANMGMISLAGAVGLAIAVVAEGQSFAIPTIVDGALLVGYGLVGQVFAWVMVSKGLPLVPASRASLILLLQPSLAFVWDMLLFARPTSQREIAGGAMALVGIYLGMIRRGA